MIDLCPKCGRLHDLNPLNGGCNVWGSPAPEIKKPDAEVCVYQIVDMKGRTWEIALTHRVDSFRPDWMARYMDVSDPERRIWFGFEIGRSEAEALGGAVISITLDATGKA